MFKKLTTIVVAGAMSISFVQAQDIKASVDGENDCKMGNQEQSQMGRNQMDCQKSMMRKSNGRGQMGRQKGMMSRGNGRGQIGRHMGMMRKGNGRGQMGRQKGMMHKGNGRGQIGRHMGMMHKGNGKGQMGRKKGMMHKGGIGPKGMFKRLNLSDEQKSKVKEITESMQSDAKVFKEQLNKIKEAQHALAKADNFDEAAFRANCKLIAKMKEDNAVKKIMIKQKMLSILTDEQRAQLKKNKDEMKINSSKSEK